MVREIKSLSQIMEEGKKGGVGEREEEEEGRKEEGGGKGRQAKPKVNY